MEKQEITITSGMTSMDLLNGRRESENYINSIVTDVINRLNDFTIDGFYELINANISGIHAYPKGNNIEVVINSYGFQMYKTYLKEELEKRIEERKLCY